MSVPLKWEHVLCAQLLPAREVQVPPLREPTILLVQILEQELVLFLNRVPWFFLWSNLGNPNLTGLVTLIQPTAISCIINTVFLSFSGIQARRAGTPPMSLRRPVEGSMRLFFKKPVIMLRTSPVSSLRILVTRTLLSCSTRTPLSLTQWCLPSGKIPQAKVLGVWSCISSEVCCAAPHFPGHQRSHFCSVHIHDVVAKKRDAPTELLQRLHGYVKQHNVDFIGVDFNMSALSTVGDVFSDPEFSAPGNSFLCGLDALEEQNRERTLFLIMPERPYEWRIHMAATSLTTQRWASDLVINPLTSLCSSISVPLTCLAPTAFMRSEHAQQRRMERRHHIHDRARRRRT